jgi:hypothetical protein
MENPPKYLGREESRHVQQQVPSAFELDDSSLMFLDLFFQHSYGTEVDLPVTISPFWPCFWPSSFLFSHQVHALLKSLCKKTTKTIYNKMVLRIQQ